jgi:hypothetical protein
LYLDFKAINSGAKATDQNIEEKLARALSGFANVAGGVLVYGITTSRGPKGEPDRAQAVTPIQGVTAFRAALERMASRVVEPVIAGVDIREIENPATLGDGVVVVRVPESIGKPHRAVRTTSEANDRYFMRTTTEIIVMPHAMLAALFGGSPPPQLELRARFVGSVQPSPRVEIRLVNRGRGSARRPCVVLTVNEVDWAPFPNSGNPYMWHADRLEDGRHICVFEPVDSPDFVLYPGQEVAIATGLVSVERNMAQAIERVRLTFEGTL